MIHPKDSNQAEPIDSNPAGSRDPRDNGNNGNPAQSAGRVTMEEQNAHPASLENPMRADAEQMPDSLPKNQKEAAEAAIPSLWG